MSVSLKDIQSRFYADPYGYVMFMYPWRVRGTVLEHFDGPDEWAKRFLVDIGKQVSGRSFDFHTPVMPILEAVSSGHGIGKSVMVAWLVSWLMDTRVYCRGTITASTLNQLESKTWPEINKWYGLRIVGREWFEVITSKNNLAVRKVGSSDQWCIKGASPNDAKKESFAGQHNVNSSSVYIFDEASGVPESIWETALGGLTDGEPHFYAFGNPTKKSGTFFDIFNNRVKFSNWRVRTIDSRSVKITNKQLLNDWVARWGIDSDFVKIRILGKFPSVGENSLFSSSLVQDAMSRGVEYLDWFRSRVGGQHTGLHTGQRDIGPRDGALRDGAMRDGAMRDFYVPMPDEPMRAGLDVGRMGNDPSILSFRRGLDGVSVPWREWSKIDTVDLCSNVSRVCSDVMPDILLIDAIGIGAGVYDSMNRSNPRYEVVDVVGSRESIHKRQFRNKRTELFFACAEWCKRPGVMLPMRQGLADDMDAVTYGQTPDGVLYVLSKKELKAELGRSIDELDSFVVTFDQPEFRSRRSGNRMYGRAGMPFMSGSGSGSWMGV